MYIISKHKDFYDSVAGQKGIDKTIIFERHITTLTFSCKKPGDKNNWWRQLHFPTYGPKSNSFRYNISREGDKKFVLFLVGFCGKMYVVAKCETQVRETKFSNVTPVVSYIYGIDNIKAAICDYYNDEDYFKKSTDKNLNHILACINDPKILELFYTHKTPQFILYDYDKDNLHVNGNLNEIDFFKVFNPFMAFQEIEMYITGVLGINNKPTVEISDKDKIAGHGFDPKYSFRKEPETKNK